MFALKDKRSGKYLKDFSGSYNKNKYKVRDRITEELNIPWLCKTKQDELDLSKLVHDRMWCLKNTNGAKLYRSHSAVANSLYSFRFSSKNTGRPDLSLEEALPWIQIVAVKTIQSK